MITVVLWNTCIGIGISLAASLVDAVGLTMQRVSHLRNSALSHNDQLPEFKRPLWIFGFFLYIMSQFVGTGASLHFLQPAVVAPLGSAALVFNLILAAIILKSRLRFGHGIGTLLIVLGSCLVAYFGDLPKRKHSIQELFVLYGRLEFLLYFLCLDVFVFLVLLAVYSIRGKLAQLARVESHLVDSEIFDKKKRKYLNWLGFGYAVAGGSVASQTILLAETSVSLLSITLSGDNQLKHWMTYIILTCLLLTVFLQIFCLNQALKSSETVLVVPVFFVFYSVLALFNGNTYYQQWNKYSRLSYGLIAVGLLLIVLGVTALSLGDSGTPRIASSADEESVDYSALSDEESSSVDCKYHSANEDKPLLS